MLRKVSQKLHENTYYEVFYGSPNVAILSELNIYSLGKRYGQCENLNLIICKENIWAVKKKRNAAATVFL